MTVAKLLPAIGHIPAFELATALPEDVDVLVVPVFTGEDGLELPTDSLTADVAEPLLAALELVGATGAHGELTRVPAPQAIEAASVLAVGLGDSDETTADQVRQACGTAARALTGVEHAATTVGVFGLAESIEGFGLGGYSYRGLKSDEVPANKQPLGKLTVVGGDDAQADFDRAVATVSAVALARDLVNTPSSHLYPARFAEVAASVADASGLTTEVLRDDELAESGYGGLTAVGGGSARGPRLVRMHYRGKPDSDAVDVALVGKGITFDTGGISLKPPAHMENMISDMGGAASIIASMQLVAALKLPLNVTATIPMAENMPSATSYRPGDVITQYGGKTCEVLNTDAEGRLVLADAIVRACEDNPSYLIDTATLTGAQIVALGNRTSGVMGTDEFRDQVADAGQAVGEDAWAMPIPAELAEGLKTPVADIRNVSNDRAGGMMVAAAYLREFVGDDVQWAHVDIAGPSYNTSKPWGYTPAKASGVPVRTIAKVLTDLAEQ